MFYKNANNQTGFTLLEMLIAVSLFTIVMLVSTTMFIRSMDTQARSVNSRNLQESLNYALALMSSEAAGAVKDPTPCSVAFECTDNTQFYCSYTPVLSANDILKYRNSGSLCVVYQVEDDANGISRLKMTRDGVYAYLTPASMQVSSLKFSTGNVDDPTYPIGVVTISITGQTLSGQEYPETFMLQTAVATTP